MKLCSLYFVFAFIVIGCNSSNDNVPTDSDDIVSGENTTITTSNYQSILFELLSVMNSISIDSFVENTNTIPTPELSHENTDIAGLTLVNRFLDSEAGQNNFEFTCNAGGRYTFKQRGQFDSIYELENCRLMGNTFDGKFVRKLSDGTSEVTFSSFEIIDDFNTSQTLTGKRFIRFSRFRNLVSYQIDRFTVGSDENYLELIDLNTNVNHDISSPASNSGERSFSSDFTLSGLFSGGQSIEVVTSTVFTNLDGDLNYSAGVFSAVATDGSQITVNADNGDINSFQIDVIAERSSSSFTENWSNRFALRCLGDPFSNAPEYLCTN